MAYSSSNAQARAISHRTWSRKKAPISRVGSYDFNGAVDRATMKMHMASADRPQGHNEVLTLWPLASTAIDKNECFAVREREVLWTMRPGKGMGRTSDGRMRALSSLNYFRLNLSNDQRDELAAAMDMKTKSKADVMAALKALVGPKRLEHKATRGMTLDTLNKVDQLLRSYVLAVIQYAGVAITGEEAGSRQHLQGIAVTVGGLNTLANNSEKTLCPGMKLCMTVPRCVPDATDWPAPCDHIGLPHGKVVPILRQADGYELSNMIMTQHLGAIYRNVAQLMTGCCNAMQETVDEEDVPVDVYFAFTTGPKSGINDHLKNVADDYSAVTEDVPVATEIANDMLDVMRRINDAVVFTMSASEKTTNKFTNEHNIRYEGTQDYASSIDNKGLAFSTSKSIGRGGSEQSGPLETGITPIWRLLIIAYGSVRDIVLANAFAAGVATTYKFYDGVSTLDVSAANGYYNGAPAIYNLTGTNGLGTLFKGKKVPQCLTAAGDKASNKKDPDAAQFAEMIVDLMDKVSDKLNANQISLNKNGQDVKPNKIKYHVMQAVSNGNASFALGSRNTPYATLKIDELGLSNISRKFQPNVVVMDSGIQYPWKSEAVKNIINSGGIQQHSKFVIVFRNTFQAPFRQETGQTTEHIEVSDNELPFVGAWVAVPAEKSPGVEFKMPADTPYRSNYLPERLSVGKMNGVKYYYLTWSALVHLVCNNVLQQHDKAKMVLEMNRAQLVYSPHYDNKTTALYPTLHDASNRKFGAPGLGSFLHAILRPDTNATTKYQDYLRKHSPIASLVKNVVQATVQAVTQHQLTTEKKTVGMALSSAGRGEAVDVVLTGAV